MDYHNSLLSIWLRFVHSPKAPRYDGIQVYTYETSLRKLLKPTLTEDNYGDRVNGLHNYNITITITHFELECALFLNRLQLNHLSQVRRLQRGVQEPA